MMIAVAFQVLEPPGHSLTCSDDSLWHFLTIHFQRSAEVRFHPRSIDVRVHNLLSRADVEWFICPLLLTPWVHGLLPYAFVLGVAACLSLSRSTHACAGISHDSSIREGF